MNSNTDAHPLGSLVTDFRKYIETRIDLIQFRAIDKSAHLVSGLLSNLILLSGSFLAVFLILCGLAYFIGEKLGKTYYGFFAVGGSVLIVLIPLLIFRRRWLAGRLADHIIREAFNQ